MQKIFKLVRHSLITLKKCQTAFLSLEDYHYDVGAQFCFVCFVCFVALRPKSTAMVIAGRSVHLTTLFPGQA